VRKVRDEPSDESRHLLGPAHQEVVGAGDRFDVRVDPRPRGLGRRGGRTELVVLGHDQQFRAHIGARRSGEFLARQNAQRGSDGHPAVEARIDDRQRGVTAEGPTAQDKGSMRPQFDHRIECSDDVGPLGPTLSMGPLGRTHPAEVEPEDAEPTGGQESEQFAGDQRGH
jgi:hypothetical protein